jgi:hypothetical protein
LGVHARSKNIAYLLQPLGPDKVSVQLSNSANLTRIYTSFYSVSQVFLACDALLFETRRTRTADVFGVNETLYQLSYSPCM